MKLRVVSLGLRGRSGGLNRSRIFVVVFGLSVGAIVVAIVAGLRIDARAFEVNLLASVVSVAVSVVIAVTVADWYLRERRKRDWDRVSEITLAAIRTHLVDFAVQCWVQRGGMPRQALDLLLAGRNIVDEQAVIGMRALVELVKEINPETETESLYDDVKWDLGQIRDVLTPRVIQVASDEGLVRALVQLENAERTWVNYLIGDAQSAIGGTLRGTIATLDAAASVYEVLVLREDAGHRGPA